MRFRIILICLSAFANLTSNGQKVKGNSIDISCYAFPASEICLENAVYSYTINGPDDMNKYGVYESGMFNTSYNKSKNSLPSVTDCIRPYEKDGRQAYHMTIAYSDLEIKARKIEKINVSAPNSTEMSQGSNAYDLTVSIQLKLQLYKGKDTVINSLESNDEVIRFPDFVPELNTPVKVFTYEKDLENYWLTHRDAFVKQARIRLINKYLMAFEGKLRDEHGISARNFDAEMYYLKDRKKQNTAFDSLFTAVELAKDSIQAHYKKKKYCHWNTTYTQAKLEQAFAINQRLIAFYANDTNLDKEVKEELHLGLWLNRIKLLTMLNRTTESQKELEQLKTFNETQKIWRKSDIDDFIKALETENKRYNAANKKRFHW